jgi:hypothetical protein
MRRPDTCANDESLMHRTIALLAALMLGTAGACRHVPESGPSPITCASGEYLEVVNGTGRRIDVYALRGSSMIPLGTVDAGRYALALPNDSSSGLAFVGYYAGTRDRVLGDENRKIPSVRLELNKRCR